MVRRVLVAFAFATFAMGITQASAAAFTFQFCPSAECTGDNVTSATLRYDELLGTADVNDYQLTATLVGGPTGSTLDEILISAGNFTQADYTSLTLNGAPGGTAAWSAPTWDNIPGCTDLPLSGNDYCLQSTNPALGPAVGTNTFVFTVNLAGTTQISASTAANFRAQFVNANGSNAGILSPSGVVVTTTVTPTTTITPTTTTVTPTTGNVPEPASMLLMGAGLVLAARRLRRNVKK